MDDVLYDKWNKKLDNPHNVNTKHTKKVDVYTNKFYSCIKNIAKKYKLIYLDQDLIMDKPIKQYIQDIDRVNAASHLDTTIHIALSHKKISQIRSQTQQTFYTKCY